MLKTLIAIFALVPAVAFAKTTHKTVTTTTTTTNADGTVTKKTTTAAAPAATTDNDQANGTLFGGSGNGSSIASSLRGLSLFAMYDFADQLENTSGGKADTERAIDIGASYETSQFTPGIAAQFGAQYDFSRAIKNDQPAVKYSEILGFAELTGHLTTQFRLMGGINYNFPSADNLGAATIKGNVGYQLGGSFAFTPHIALDARYRSVQYTVSANGQSADLKENGFTMGARYMF